MSRRRIFKVAPLIVVLSMVLVTMAPAFAAPAPPTAGTAPVAQPAGIFRGVSTAAKFDVSPPLRDIVPLAPQASKPFEIPERSGLEGTVGPQTPDGALQTTYGPSLIPAPSVSFNGPGNISSVSPPDPVGDVGPNHYVAMSNLSFAVYSKTGTLLYGPALNNTLWAGFGGDCQTDNSGDPIVLYDQFSDRWMLSQFTASGPTYFNCVAISTTPDPTGTYYRYAFGTGTNFPDYPKYGWWSDALYISTRDFAGGSTYVGIGAYAIDRAQLIAGNPAPTVISFLVPLGATPYNIGDGLLPADIDGSTLPPGGSPQYFMGSMDDGGTYGAPQDALTLWKFDADFVTPANSTFTLANTIPIAPIDTFAAFCSGRSCVPQPGTANRLDHLGYRQRPLWRLAYRNFGSHESLVTNQSVEASSTMSGIRWWEVRSPNSSPVLYQDSTYAPGLTDGIFRWMGSIAMDGAGNMALGYSASNATTTFPSVWYTGRLASDPLNTMPQGEGSIIDGTGSQTGSQRWGDYTSMNIDPVDDCTFWYVNQWVPTTSSVGWQLRIGAFKFNECGSADFTLSATPASQDICVGADADYTINVGQVSGFTDPVTLSASGNPAGTTTSFSVNPVNPPGSSTLTIGNTGAAAAGAYSIDVVGVAPTSTHTTTVGLNVYAAAPAAPALTSPANNAVNVSTTPTYSWSDTGAASYTIEIATDNAFSNIVDSATVPGTSYVSGVTLNSSTTYYWRVGAGNTCGYTPSTVYFTFTTEAAPGDCGPGTTPNILYETGFESGAGGWTSSGTGDTWAIAASNPNSGAQHFHANDPAAVSDQRLVSPAVVIPSGQNPVVLKFWHEPNLEPSGATNCYDGGILEVSTDGGSNWTQVPNGDLLAGQYRSGTVSAAFSNPLAGLQAWCGETAYIQTIADVSSYAGTTAQFRMRLGSDTSVSAPGWDVDDVVVQSCQPSGDAPNIYVDPLSMASTQATNTSTNQLLNIANTGGGTLDWTIDEENLPGPDPILPTQSSTYHSSAAGKSATQPVTIGDNVLAAAGTGVGQTATPDRAATPDGLMTITHSASQSIVALNSVSCNAGGLHTDNSYIRVFDLAAFGLPNGLDVTNVEFGIEQALGATGAQPVAVNLYVKTNPAGPLTFANLTPIGTAPVSVSDQSLTILSVPVAGTAGPGSVLVVEVFTPEGQTDGNSFFIGSNAAGQTAPSYLAAAGCGVTEPTDTAALGFPGMHIVMNVTGDADVTPVACTALADIPWLSLSATAGSNAGGTDTDVTVTFDSTSLADGVYTGNLCVTSNDPDAGPGNETDLVIVPVTLTVQPPTAVALTDLAAGTDQMPAPAGVPLGAVAAAGLSMALAAGYALRRRRQE